MKKFAGFVLLAAALWGAYVFWTSLMEIGPDPAGVAVGHPVKWREIPGNWAPEPVIGDFDGDGNEELLAFDNDTNQAHLFDRNLQSRQLGTHLKAGWSFPRFVWDANGDGRDDLEVPTYPEPMKFCDLQGRMVYESPSLRRACDSPFDFDGDGKLDLAVTKQAGGQSAKEMIVVGPGGKEVWRYTSPQHIRWAMPGDFDGDGRAELLVSEATSIKKRTRRQRRADFLTGSTPPEEWNYKLVLHGAGDQPKEIGLPSVFSPEPVAAIDLNADGAAELILGGYGALDLKSGKYSEFPKGTLSYEVRPADFDGDGQPDLCMETNLEGDLLVRDMTGRIKYHEYFGHAMFMGPYVMRTRQRDHIVINKREVALLVYP